MTTALALLLLLALVVGVTAAVERNHRRLGDADRSPFGVDLESDRDAVRAWHDVSALYAHVPESPTRTSYRRAA